MEYLGKKKGKKNTGVLTTRDQTGWPKKTTAAHDSNIVRIMKETFKTTVSDLTNNFHNPPFKEDLEKETETQADRSSMVEAES